VDHLPEIPYFWIEAALFGLGVLVLAAIHIWRAIRSEVRPRTCVYCGQNHGRTSSVANPENHAPGPLLWGEPATQRVRPCPPPESDRRALDAGEFDHQGRPSALARIDPRLISKAEPYSWN
jgi:hypothetical protein